MNGMFLSARRDFNYEYEEHAFMRFMQIILVACALVFVWGVYSHIKQINLVNNGTAVLAEVYTYTGGERISFVAEDGKTYGNNISGMFLPEHDNTLMVYYIDNPANAMPLTDVKFSLAIYAVSIAGIAFALWQMKRIQDSIGKNKTTVKEEY